MFSLELKLETTQLSPLLKI